MDLGLTNRAAVVGGASSGLGLATADALAAEGCRLAIWSRDTSRLEPVAAGLRTRHGGEVHVLLGDATEPGTGARIAAEAQRLLGQVDIVVLNAGGPPPVDPTQTDAAAGPVYGNPAMSPPSTALTVPVW